VKRRLLGLNTRPVALKRDLLVKSKLLTFSLNWVTRFPGV